MSNLNSPTGFKPIRHLNGSPYNGQTGKYAFASGDSVACFPGDMVKLTGTADANGIPVIAKAAAGDALLGSLEHVEPNPDDVTKVHRIASRVCFGYVADSPDIIFEAQEDSVGGAIAVASVGLATDIVAGSGSSVTGVSNSEIDSSDVATDTGGQVRILRIVERPGNAVGVNAKWEVMINEHQYRSVLDI